MHDLEVGQEIGVRCDMAPGPFSGEYLVTIDTVSGPVSGFVVEENMIKRSHDENFVRATVREVGADTISVWINGSFFTTTGLAQIAPHIATSLQ